MSPACPGVVPTYRRLSPLTACRDGLRAQTRPIDEVVVVVHTSDPESASYVDGLAPSWAALRQVWVSPGGLVAALNRGLSAATGELVGFVDDDAVPGPDWARQMVDAFCDDERIAAVGGRDVIFVDGEILGPGPPSMLRRLFGAPDVGRIQWCGRMLGNHHLGTGPPRDTDVLKGVNMSFRRDVVASIGFDERLRGDGAEVHSEMSICLPLRRMGLRVIYDPGIVVQHYPAPRGRGEQRNDFGHAAVSASTHNEALQILDHFSPARRLIFTVWGVAIGTRAAPGLVVLARDLVARRPGGWDIFRAAQRGRAAAWVTHLAGRHHPAELSR